jgi:serine protease
VFAYYFWQGTSMATPHVAGFAALLIQQGITSPAAIEAAMKQFATDLGRPGLDSEYGEGLINPRATLRGLGLAK